METQVLDLEQEKFRKAFGVVLRRYRFRRELENPEFTQAYLAQKVGLSEEAIVSLENGREAASVEVLQKVAEALDLNFSELRVRLNEALQMTWEEIREKIKNLWKKSLFNFPVSPGQCPGFFV